MEARCEQGACAESYGVDGETEAVLEGSEVVELLEDEW